MKILHHDLLEVTSNLKLLQCVLDWFERQRVFAIDQDTWLQCQLALTEGFTNAVSHAHRHLPIETPITIELIISAHYLEIKVWDSGPPFDLTAQLRQIKSTLDLDRPRGRGLLLLQKIAQQLQYRRTADDRNCLSIVKLYTIPKEAIPA